MGSRTNAEWLADLQGPDKDAAISDLRAVLVRGLTYALSNRIFSDLDVLVEDFVQDALLRILDKIDTFRGESRFTTWAQRSRFGWLSLSFAASDGKISPLRTCCLKKASISPHRFWLIPALTLKKRPARS